ncbi:MAG: ABC transporter permease [Synergistaceae bacterium]|jgi:peptide/nickel transport system permease protein|nr:ABC transporter permease [Synergistaceae bacterium]
MQNNSPMSNAWRKLKKNKWAMASLVIIILLLLTAIFAPYLTPYDYAAQNYDNVLESPGAAHPFGTDNFGRDVLSRIVYGSRYTVFIGFGCITIATVIGVTLGLLAAYFSKLDNVIMRAIDIIIGMPTMTLLMCIIAALGVNITNMIIALCVTSIPNFARVTRAQALTIKNQEFIEASVAIGASDGRILWKHILPNSLAPIIIEYSLSTGNLVLWSASLSFIGMGVQPPIPEWGLMISTGRPYLRSAWFLSILPGLAIILLTFVLNYLGDGLRDALDPRLNK